MRREFYYYGAKIYINEEYENGDVDAKIFPNKNDISFIGSRFSKEQYNKTLDMIKNGKFELGAAK